MDAKKTNWSNRHPESNRKKFLKRFGLTLDDYAKMLETQNGVCAVCGRPETIVDPRNETVRCLSVDHNHKTGKVRGLLCTKCNSLIGFAEDSFQTLILAAAYLRRYQ